MVGAIAWLELRQQLRSHVFWVVAAISLLMVVGSVSVDELRVGLSDGGMRNGARAVVETHLVWSLFFMFTTAAFVADAMLRDELTGFAPLIRATPTRWRDLVLGRFAGAFAAVLLCYLSVPLGLLVAGSGPWHDPATVGPIAWAAYPFALLAMAMPNLLLSAAVSFGLVTATRSMGGALLGAVALLVVYGLGSVPGGGTTAAILEPFGFAAYARAVREWAVADRDIRVPALVGALLANRLLWLGVSGALLAIAQSQFQLPRRSAAPTLDVFVPTPAREPSVWVSPSSRAGVLRSQMTARTRLEFGRILYTPVFAVLVLLALANAAAALWPAGDPAHGLVTTGTMIAALVGAFRIVPTVIALFFAGELMWADREQGMHELIGASPLAEVAFVLPKLLALACAFVLLASATAGLAILVQALRGSGDLIDVGSYLLSYVAPTSWDWTLIAVLALFLQAMSPNKVAGWGWMVLYLITSLTLQKLGLNDPLYRYGRYPGWPLPAALSGAADVSWFRAYWGAVAVLLTATACLLGRRGDVGRGLPRRRRVLNPSTRRKGKPVGARPAPKGRNSVDSLELPYRFAESNGIPLLRGAYSACTVRKGSKAAIAIVL